MSTRRRRGNHDWRQGGGVRETIDGDEVNEFVLTNDDDQ